MELNIRQMCHNNTRCEGSDGGISIQEWASANNVEVEPQSVWREDDLLQNFWICFSKKTEENHLENLRQINWINNNKY